MALLRRAVRLEDALAYNEPEDVFVPARHLLGSALLSAGFPAQAETVYREDLKRHPSNGWALAGLAEAQAVQGKSSDAAATRGKLAISWRRADVNLRGSSF